ncbi:MAG: PEP-CTERM sorting domain-containing protein [Gemmatimonas sp.]
MRSIKLSIAALSLLVGLSSTASAQQVNFEDAGTYFGFLSNGYAGHDWSNAFVVDPFIVLGSAPSGLATVVSGTHVVLNGGGQAMSISGGTFNLLGGNFAAAWTNGLNLNVKGFSAGNLLYNQNYSLDWSSAQSLALNLFGVDNVVFSSSGGTRDQLFPDGSNQSFVADNLEFSAGSFVAQEVGVNVVPEPMTVSLMAAGLLILGGVQSRRRRASQAR